MKKHEERFSKKTKTIFCVPWIFWVPVKGYTCHSKSCVNGNNIIKYEDYTRDQCADACNADEECEGFEYGVNHGGSATDYNPRDCQLQSSADMDGCDGAYHNLDFCVKNRNSSA